MLNHTPGVADGSPDSPLFSTALSGQIKFPIPVNIDRDQTWPLSGRRAVSRQVNNRRKHTLLPVRQTVSNEGQTGGGDKRYFISWVI